MSERTTTREQWKEIASEFLRIQTARGILFSDALSEMGFSKGQYHRMHRCLRGPTKARPQNQKTINAIQKWNTAHAKRKTKKRK